MEKEDQKKSAAMEKARLKAEYKKIMNEKHTSTRNQKEGVKGSTSSSSSSSSASYDSTKRKNEEDQKKKAKAEKARLKAEYKKIMNEKPNSTREKEG